MSRKPNPPKDDMIRYFVCGIDGPTGWACGVSPEAAILQWLTVFDRWSPEAKARWASDQARGYSVRPFLLVPAKEPQP